MNYVKKPVVFSACQWSGESEEDFAKFDKWMRDAKEDGTITIVRRPALQSPETTEMFEELCEEAYQCLK